MRVVEAADPGVDALEQERFAYTPTPGGLSTALAKLYVRRDRWLNPLLLVVAVAVLIAGAWYVAVERPQQQYEAALPGRIESVHGQIVRQSQAEAAVARADELLSRGQRAIRTENFKAAEDVHGELRSLLREVALAYEIRIVSRPNELSGVWRVPDLNPDARNYYLIVEAVDAAGNVLERRVRNEEDGRYHRVRKWGLRVDEATFEAVAADKRDDGIINDYVLGRKSAGQLEPEYRVPTSGAALTEW